MMAAKSSMVATLGTSPPVVTELLQHLLSVGERLTDITVLYTAEPDVEAAFEAVKCAVADRHPRVRVHGVRVEFEDIATTGEALRFLKLAAGVLRREFVRHRVERVHLNLSGGRKSMAIALATLAQFFGVAGAYLVVARDVKAFNARLERVRGYIRELAEAPDPLAYYRERREYLEPVMYPDPGEYEVVEIPVVPFPRDALGALLSLARRGRAELASVGLSEGYALALRRAGIIATVRGEAYLTDVGRELASALEEAWGVA